MNDPIAAMKVLSTSLVYFATFIEKVNDWIPTNDKYKYPCLFPGIKPNHIKDLAKKLKNSSSILSDTSWFLELVKNDFGNVDKYKGHIEFKALTKLVENNPKYLNLDYKSGGSESKYKPVVLFEWPPAGQPVMNWGWGTSILMELAAFSLDYDFVSYSDYYYFKFNNIKIALELKSLGESGSIPKKLKTIYTTPYIPMTVEVRIPKKINISVALPDITFEFFKFKINLNLNFDWKNFNFSPLHIHFPDWPKCNFPSINFGSFLKFGGDCKWTFGLILPDGIKFPDLPNIKFVNIKIYLMELCKWLGFSCSGTKIDYFEEVKYGADSGKIPEWAAIYLNLNFLKKVLGGYQPKQLHFLVGVNSKDYQVKVGFLTCTGNIVGDKSFMLRGALQYDFELTEDNKGDSQIEAHPGFSLELLSDKVLATAAGCPQPSEAKVAFGGFSVRLDRLGLQWEKDISAYVCSVDGEFAIQKLLKSADPSTPDKDLKLSFKGLSFTTDGQFVMEKTWKTLTDAQQVKLDGISQIGLFLKAYGYEKKPAGPFGIGFSGDIHLPVLNVGAGVDNLIIRSNGDVELSGINLDLAIAKALKLVGSVKWGDNLAPPHLPKEAKKVSGFAGQLKLVIIPISFECMMGITYVKCQTNSSGDLIAWSFAGEVTIPGTIPICCGIGISSLGMMVGRNYIPKPKQQGLPYDQWLERGYNKDVENILDVVNYWSVAAEAFAAGFSIGLGTSMDNCFILCSKSIMVLVIPGPLIMIAGKADVLRKSTGPLVGNFNLLIIYDHDDPGILVSLAFRYDVKSLVSIRGMAEIYFDFDEPNRWHFYLGTPAKPVAAKALGIFEAKGYLTIDSSKLAVGAMVFYGKNWSAGPLALKAYITFSSELAIGWNPVFIFMGVGIEGEFAVRIFGFGLGASLAAELQIKAPSPWYMYAMIAARFSISFFFFTWSFTVKFELSWGSKNLNPPVILPPLYDDKRLFKALAGSLRTYTSLTPDKYKAGGNPVERFLPMDGVLGLEFARDVEITLGSKFKLKDTYSVKIEDEPSPNASNFKAFHIRLTDFKVEKQSSGKAYTTVPDTVYFVWTPVDDDDRKKLIVRNFDLGFSQFRLNDDPNAYVKLTCPDIFQTNTSLLFVTRDPDLSGGFVLHGALIFNCVSCTIAVELSKVPKGPESYTLDYSHFTAKLSTNGVIPLQTGGQSGQRIALEPGMVLELGLPSACILLDFEPGQPLATGTLPKIKDYFTLYDEVANDITKICDNNVYKAGKRFFVLLNDFEDAPNYYPRKYSAQKPPAVGVKRVVVKAACYIWQMLKPRCYFSLYPLEALRQIYRDNLDRMHQKAKLEYLFEQNNHPGKILLEDGKHRVSGKALWWVDNKDEKEPKTFTEQFTVIKPFEHKVVQVNEEQVEVQPFTPYVRRITPANGTRPYYRQQLPNITYRCNYVNWMLQKGKRRLALFLFDINNRPCTYSKLVVEFFDVSTELAKDFLTVSRNNSFNVYRDVEEIHKKIPEIVPGLDPSTLEGVFGPDWLEQLEGTSATEIKGQESPPAKIRAFVTSGRTLLFEAREMYKQRISASDRDGRKRARKLEKLLEARFSEEQDRALVFQMKESLLVARIRIETGIVEYRYTNDDLALDVSTLQLSDCLKPGQGQKLNAYERGYFAPVLPKLAFWEGLKPNTRYTGRIYSLDKDEKIENKLPDEPEIHSFSFTTSLFDDIEGLKAMFSKCKVRDLRATKQVYKDVIGTLSPDLVQKPFGHPDGSNTSIHLGLDIFREMSSAPPVSAGNKPLSRSLEEAHMKLWEKKRSQITKSRKAEGMALERIFDAMNLTLDPLSPKRITATWLRIVEGANHPDGTIGLLIDFPEPVDWERTGVSVKKFEAKISEYNQVIDMLNPPKGDPSYQVTLHWIRSLDGTRLMLIPRLVRARVNNPYVVVAASELESLASRGITDKVKFTALTSEVSSAALLTTEEITASPVETPAKASPSEFTSTHRRFIGDFAIVSTTGVLEFEEIDKIYQDFGQKTVENVSRYEVISLDLEFYYLCDNYEKKNKDKNYRTIPRLKYRFGRPGDSNGKIGVLTSLKRKGK